MQMNETRAKRLTEGNLCRWTLQPRMGADGWGWTQMGVAVFFYAEWRLPTAG